MGQHHCSSWYSSGAHLLSRQVAVLQFPDNALLLLFITAVDATFVAAFVVAFVATFLLAPRSSSLAILCGSAGEMALFIDYPFLAIKFTNILLLYKSNRQIESLMNYDIELLRSVFLSFQKYILYCKTTQERNQM